MTSVDLKQISWKKDNHLVKGYFIQTLKGYLRVNIIESEFYEEFPEGAKIEDAEINILGKVKVK